MINRYNIAMDCQMYKLITTNIKIDKLLTIIIEKQILISSAKYVYFRRSLVSYKYEVGREEQSFLNKIS